MLVFDDADLDLAIAGALASKYRNAGQTCVAPDHVIAHRTVKERLVGALQEWLPAEKTRHYLSARHGRGYLIGALIGAAIAFVADTNLDRRTVKKYIQEWAHDSDQEPA